MPTPIYDNDCSVCSLNRNQQRWLVTRPRSSTVVVTVVKTLTKIPPTFDIMLILQTSLKPLQSMETRPYLCFFFSSSSCFFFISSGSAGFCGRARLAAGGLKPCMVIDRSIIWPLSNVLTDRLKWCEMLRQIGESTYPPTVHVFIAKDAQRIQSSDFLKWLCALWRYVISLLFSDQTSFQMVRQIKRQYFNQ